jgi:predicted ATPase
MLKKVTLLRDRIQDWQDYPFCVPVIRHFDELKIRSRVCFFTGENGTGKSTLLEAIAAHYGFGPEGGNRHLKANTTESNRSTDPLARALRLSFDIRTGKGYFLRAESFFNTATLIDDLGVVGFYGDKSLHNRSHGESFFTLLEHKFRNNGFFLLDEPEAALSPQRQLAFLVLMHDVLKGYKDAQFIISTHSPVLLGFPDAQIVSFDGDQLCEIEYENTSPAQVVRGFMNHREAVLEELFQELPLLFRDVK